MWGLIVSALIEAVKKIFGSGLEKSIKIAARLAFFFFFSSLIIYFVDYFLSYIRNYSFAGLDGCNAYAINVIGVFPALGIFFQIVALGFWAKFALSYFKDSV